MSGPHTDTKISVVRAGDMYTVSATVEHTVHGYSVTAVETGNVNWSKVSGLTDDAVQEARSMMAALMFWHKADKAEG